MTPRRIALIRLWGGALIFLVGVLWTVHTGRTFTHRLSALHRKQIDLEALTYHASERERQLDAVRVFEQLDTTRLADLSALARAFFPEDAQREIRRRESAPVWGPWHAVRMEVQLDQAPLPAVGRFLEALTAARPPWTVIEGHIQALDHRPGQARVTLLVEGLEQR